MTELPTFADFVRQDVADRFQGRKKIVERLLPIAQREYDDNLAAIKRLGIIDQFNEAAQSIREITKRKAFVDVSPRPVMGISLLDENCPAIVGSAECEITFKWEPPNTQGVEHSITVRVHRDNLCIHSGKGQRRFHLPEVQDETLHQLLFDVYRQPLWNGHEHS